MSFMLPASLKVQLSALIVFDREKETILKETNEESLLEIPSNFFLFENLICIRHDLNSFFGVFFCSAVFVVCHQQRSS